jgi:hypothetical protein
VQPRYIREAYRLLQQSIIFVEAEDIELMDEAPDATDGEDGSADDRDDDHPGKEGYNATTTTSTTTSASGGVGDIVARMEDTETVGRVLESMGHRSGEDGSVNVSFINHVMNSFSPFIMMTYML